MNDVSLVLGDIFIHAALSVTADHDLYFSFESKSAYCLNFKVKLHTYHCINIRLHFDIRLHFERWHLKNH